jgi:signal transduction histidine kinase
VWRLLLVLAITALSWIELVPWQLENAPRWFVADIAVGVVSTVVTMVWRRRFPVTVAVVTNLVAVGSFSSAGAASLALTSLATRRRWREIVPVTAAVLLTIPATVAISPVPGPDPRVDAAVVVVVVLFMVATGMYVGSRRELLETLRSRAEIVEAEQSAKLAQARSAERTRIAREMHDVLAHRISLVTMHAGALAYRDDLPPEQVRESARTIQETAHQAMEELRAVLGVLREDPGDAAPELPMPTAADLSGLVAEWQRAGMRVALDVEGDLATVPAGAGRTVFRVVQEALTNAHKHASATTVRVRVVVEAREGVWVEVRNPLPVGSAEAPAAPAGSGLGLVGLRERVELAGGRLRHGVTARDRTFALDAWLPWPA